MLIVNCLYNLNEINYINNFFLWIFDVQYAKNYFHLVYARILIED